MSGSVSDRSDGRCRTRLAQLFVQGVDPQWLILAALTLLTGTFTVRIPGIPARLSVSDTFVFASVLLFGPAAGTITALLDALIISLRVGQFMQASRFGSSSTFRWLRSSTRLSGEVFFTVAGIPPYSIAHTPLGQILFPLFLFTLSYFLLNSWLVTFALALESNRSRRFPIWRDNFCGCRSTTLAVARSPGLLVTYTREIDFTTLGIIVPLLLISYLTFKTSLGQNRGRQPAPHAGQQDVSVNDRNVGNGDRRQGSDHARSHSARSTTGSRPGRVDGR